MSSNNNYNFSNWEETEEADKIDYYNDRKHGIIQIFCRIRLPYKFYEVANAISIIYDLKSFDDYVSRLVYEDIENQIHNGTDVFGDSVLNKITGEQTYWHTAEEDSKEKADLGLPSREEVEKRWGKIPDDPDEAKEKEEDEKEEASNKIG